MAKRKLKETPTDSGTGAAQIKAAMVELFDRKDGTGADWQLMAESVFRAGFDLVDDKLTPEARQGFYLRIHEGSYRRISEEATGTTEDTQPVPVAGAVDKSKSMRPFPPS